MGAVLTIIGQDTPAVNNLQSTIVPFQNLKFWMGFYAR
ncbi:hypothetical protein BH24DEI2_BH24DEI2_24880 [soil metagenome]